MVDAFSFCTYLGLPFLVGPGFLGFGLLLGLAPDEAFRLDLLSYFGSLMWSLETKGSALLTFKLGFDVRLGTFGAGSELML